MVSFLLVPGWARSDYRSDLAGIAGDIPLLVESKFAELKSRRSRRRAAHAAEDRNREREVQKAQIDLVVAAGIYGTYSAEVDQAKFVLSAL